MKDILLIDSSLRDGNHAVKHQLNKEQIAAYAAAANAARMPIIVVGHGNGLGASSLQVGECALTDREMLETARKKLTFSKLAVFDLPGFATLKKDIQPAIELGVDVFCVGCHCTEADVTERHINYVREKGKQVYGNLMMTHMVSKDVLVEECLKMQSYGVNGVILMDSAGSFLPQEVKEKIAALVEALDIPVGFHAHNNLGLSVAHSITAVESGAVILDACSRGFGAGAGNAPLEILVAVLEKLGYNTGVDLYKMLDAADLAEKELIKEMPIPKSVNIVSGLAGVFSGFVKHVDRVSRQYGVDPRDVFFELGRRKVVAGQEDQIIEVVLELAEAREKKNGKK